MVRSAPRALVLAGIVMAAAACADHNPAGPRVSPPDAVPPPVQAALRCRMDVRAETFACRPADAGTAPGISPLIIGGQGTNVRLTSTGTSYDAGTGIFRSEVTVENLMAKALGTEDGVFPSPQGVRVFFHTGPTASVGSGEVTVANADGQAVFTAGAQPYFRYAGLLAPGDTSAPREWRFHVPSTVELFEFTVFVSAVVPGETTPGAGIFVLSTPSDTVDGTPDSLLRIGVRDADGKPAANSWVEVAAKLVPLAGQFEVMVTHPGGSFFEDVVYGQTDSSGIVEFRVKMGRVAGRGRLAVTSLSSGIRDTARLTILPGRVSEVRIQPEDTTVRMGARAPLRVASLDRYGNARGDTAVLTVAAGPGTMAGRDVVAGSSIGEVRPVATVGGVSDTSYVRVVPAGTAAAYSTGFGPSLYVFSLDGSDVREVRAAAAGAGSSPMPVDWLGSTRLVYQDTPPGGTTQVHVLDLESGESARFLPEADRMETENLPNVGLDGAWVYFSGGTSDAWSIYRARPDGTGKERLSFSPGEDRQEWGADPSPDGTRIVFVRGTGLGDLTVGDLGTGAARPLGLQGLFPRWSPDGTRIAFVQSQFGWPAPTGTLMVANADGTGARALAAATVHGAFDWSPDGKYIIAGTQFIHRLVIVEVATGAEVVVPYPGAPDGLTWPVWKP